MDAILSELVNFLAEQTWIPVEAQETLQGIKAKLDVTKTQGTNPNV